MDERRRAREREAATGDPAAIAAAAVEACRRGEHEALVVAVTETADDDVLLQVGRGLATFWARDLESVGGVIAAMNANRDFRDLGGVVLGTFAEGVWAAMPCRCGEPLQASCPWPLLARDVDRVGDAFAAFEREEREELRAMIVRARRDDPDGWAVAERFTLEHGRGAFELRDPRRAWRPPVLAGLGEVSSLALDEWRRERRLIVLERVTWVCSAHAHPVTWDVVQVEGHGDLWPTTTCPTCRDGDHRPPPAPRQSNSPDASSAQSGPPIR